ncbi:MAG: succinate dehydrogenase assembly factor 2 [Gammaproteobacteria bacterium]|nr:succinate dehydrogenase assembly factor 2 [Gammaproteobacteria bacterium]
MSSTIPPQLYWACRRGMLELDVLLGKFLEGAYLKLSPEEQEIFVSYLRSQDQTLFLWLTGRETPEDPAFKRMTEKIIQYARQSF